MRRSRLEEQLEDLVAGDLEEAARLEMERRIESEPETRALYVQVRSAHEALRTLRERPEPPVRAEDVLPAIQAAILAQRFERRPRLYLQSEGTRFYRRLAVAATLLMAVSLGAFAIGRLAPDAPTTPLPVSKDRSHGDDPRARITPAEERLLQAGSEDGISAEEYFRLLEDLKDRPRMRVQPVVNFMPVPAEER